LSCATAARPWRPRRPAQAGADLVLRDQILARISSEEPIRPCDQPKCNWRTWCAAHGLADPEEAHLLDDDMEARGDGDDSGYGPNSYWTHSMSKDD
jgi:hypothetical protein